jgi:hypothetical protein
MIAQGRILHFQHNPISSISLPVHSLKISIAFYDFLNIFFTVSGVVFAVRQAYEKPCRRFIADIPG